MTLIMTLILQFDLDIMKTYLRTKKNFVGQGTQKLKPERDRHTNSRDWTHYHATFAGGRPNNKNNNNNKWMKGRLYVMSTE